MFCLPHPLGTVAQPLRCSPSVRSWNRGAALRIQKLPFSPSLLLKHGCVCSQMALWSGPVGSTKSVPCSSNWAQFHLHPGFCWSAWVRPSYVHSLISHSCSATFVLFRLIFLICFCLFVFYNMIRLRIFQIFKLWFLPNNSCFNPSLSFLTLLQTSGKNLAAPATLGLDLSQLNIQFYHLQILPSTKHYTIIQPSLCHFMDCSSSRFWQQGPYFCMRPP